MTSPEPESSSSGAGGSLADRISKPEVTTSSVSGLSAAAATFQPASGKSWADEVNSPVSANPDAAPAGLDAVAKPSSGANEESPSEIAQVDGATEPFNGSQLHEPDYTVELKLADLQADPNNPLYSVKSFEELGL